MPRLEREECALTLKREWIMLTVPMEVVCGGVFPHLTVCELQALDSAYTNKSLRPQLRLAWKSYQHIVQDEITYDELCWFYRIGAKMIEAKLYWPNNDPANVIGMVARFPTLRYLSCTFSIPDVALQQLALGCPLLEMVSLSAGGYGDVGISTLAKNCTQLKNVYIKCNDITDISVTALAENCHQLNALRVSGAVTDAGIQALCDKCPHLQHIGVSGCDNVTNISLIAIGNTYPHIQSISVCSDSVTDDGLMYLADKCHELRSANVWGRSFTKRGFTALWAANPNLIDVNVSYTKISSDEGILDLVQCCPKLQKLNFSCCTNVTDDAVIDVAEHCPQLISLNIADCNRRQTSDISLVALSIRCHELRSIDMSYLSDISDHGIAALAEGCPLLQEFCASWSNITDTGIVILANACRDLRKIGLDYCKRVGCPAVSAIAENCSMISVLNFYKCPNVDDACLYAIAQHCRNLTVLNVSHTNIIDAASVVLVVSSCKMLRIIKCPHRINEGDRIVRRIDHCDYELRR